MGGECRGAEGSSVFRSLEQKGDNEAVKRGNTFHCSWRMDVYSYLLY